MKERQLEYLAYSLYSVRRTQKALARREASIKKQLKEAWGPLVAKRETRIVGSVRLTASRRTHSEYFFPEIQSYLADLGLGEVLPQLVERKVSKKAVNALVKSKVLPREVASLLHETPGYLVWTCEEVSEEAGGK